MKKESKKITDILLAKVNDLLAEVERSAIAGLKAEMRRSAIADLKLGILKKETNFKSSLRKKETGKKEMKR